MGKHFRSTIPTSRYVNAVTETDREGTGVVPDIAATKESALQAAERIALEKLVKEQPEYPFPDERKRALKDVRKSAPK